MHKSALHLFVRHLGCGGWRSVVATSGCNMLLAKSSGQYSKAVVSEFAARKTAEATIMTIVGDQPPEVVVSGIRSARRVRTRIPNIYTKLWSCLV